MPPGQLEVGELLITRMYQPNPDLSSCSQQQLMQLLQLEDLHYVPKAVFAASRQLSSIKTEDLEWDTVEAMYSLPPACPKMEPYKALFAAAADKLQDVLGDLENASGDPGLRKQLLRLPHLGLLHLLQYSRTRVVSENTVAALVQCWIQRQQQANMRKQQRAQRKAAQATAEPMPAAQQQGQQQAPAPLQLAIQLCLNRSSHSSSSRSRGRRERPCNVIMQVRKDQSSKNSMGHNTTDNAASPAHTCAALYTVVCGNNHVQCARVGSVLHRARVPAGLHLQWAVQRQPKPAVCAAEMRWPCQQACCLGSI